MTVLLNVFAANNVWVNKNKMDLLGPQVYQTNPRYTMRPGSVGSIGDANTYIRMRRSEALQPIRWASVGRNPGSNVKNGWQARGGRLSVSRGGGLPHRYVIGQDFHGKEPRSSVAVYKEKVSGKQTRTERLAYVQDNFSSKVWGFGPRAGHKIGGGNYPRVVAYISEEVPLQVINPPFQPVQQDPRNPIVAK